MRCLSCDRKLNDRESTRKYSSSGTFVDLCNKCFSFISDDVPVIEDEGINPTEYIGDEDDEEQPEDFDIGGFDVDASNEG